MPPDRDEHADGNAEMPRANILIASCNLMRNKSTFPTYKQKTEAGENTHIPSRPKITKTRVKAKHFH